MVKHLSQDVFFEKFLQKGSIDDLQDPNVRKWTDKGYLAVKDGKQIYVTKGKKLADAA